MRIKIILSSLLIIIITTGCNLLIQTPTEMPNDHIKPLLPVLSITATMTPIPPSELKIGSTQTSQKDGMILMYVPAGEFNMGVEDPGPYTPIDVTPSHKVFLDAFWIDQTEVTNAQFEKFEKETGYKSVTERQNRGYVYYQNMANLEDGANWRHPFGKNSDIEGFENHPVVQVSWKDAITYCSWAGRRLPTEAEWEKAARGTDGRVFPWGNKHPENNFTYFAIYGLPLQNSDVRSIEGYPFTKPVGSYPIGISPYGVLDMAGNVREWVADWFGPYSEEPQRNPLGPLSGDRRAIRGGSWFDHYPLYSYERYNDNNLLGDTTTGFRCAVSQ